MLFLGLVAAADAAGPVEEMVIEAPSLDPVPVTATQRVLSDPGAVRPFSLADAVVRLPGAVVGTNSRGETLLVFRNGGERQTAFFFDGAPLTVPWDHRLDLALLPTTGLGAITATTGPASVRFGPNSAGGVLELIPEIAGDRPRAILMAEGGQQGLIRAEGLGEQRWGDLGLTASAGTLQRGGLPVSDRADLPFSQPPGRRRLNTDLSRTNVLGRLTWQSAVGDRLAASLLYVRSRFGIAPESAVDPTESDVRFWRYPRTRHLVGVLNGRKRLGTGWDLDATGWVQAFDQTIDSFAGAAYETLEDRQIDENLTWGGRAVLERLGERVDLRLFAQGLSSEHIETEIDLLGDSGSGRRRFAQRTLFGGVETLVRLGAATEVSLGVSGSGFLPTATGGAPDSGDFTGIEAVGGLRQHLTERLSLRLAAGRKLRHPSMRELFGDAIGRFLINPDLRSEVLLLGEAELNWQGETLALSLVPFVTDTQDTIDQRNLVVDGQTLRQRINLPGSRAIGLEARGVWSPALDWRLEGQVSWARLRRRDDAEAVRIAERPSVQAFGAVDYGPDQGFGGRAELSYRGRAFSFTEQDAFVPLNTTVQLNLEARYRTGPAELYVRVDNATDAPVEPQLGLPAAGRWLRGGLRLAF